MLKKRRHPLPPGTYNPALASLGSILPTCYCGRKVLALKLDKATNRAKAWCDHGTNDPNRIQELVYEMNTVF